MISAAVGDWGSVFAVTVRHGGDLFLWPAGTTAVFRFHPPNGEAIAVAGTVVSAGLLEYKVTEIDGVHDVAGKWKLEVTITGGDEWVFTLGPYGFWVKPSL